MAGFEEKLSEILSSPESMEQIFALAKSLEGGGKSGGEPQQKNSAVSAPPSIAQMPPIDPKMMEMLSRLMREYGHDDKTVAALVAIKPFLKKEKQIKIDRAMEMAKLARIAKLALGGGENL
ncbi:MAG: hypothetical protein IJP23_04305 [Oscillospiraceae bacterium]|nr:hypothetical protein [Oscillospiraceae bacterium]